MKFKLLMLMTTLFTFNSYALDCTNFAGKTLKKINESTWLLTADNNKPLELLGAYCYQYDGLNTAYNLTDINENSYHLIQKLIFKPICRHRGSCHKGTSNKFKVLFSTNGSDNEHFNCL